MANIDHYFGIWTRNANPSDADVEAGIGASIPPVHANAWYNGLFASAAAVAEILTNLSPGTDYDLEWYVIDADQNKLRGVTHQFTTDYQPTVTSVEDIGTGLAQLWWGEQAYIHGSQFGATQGGSSISVEDAATTELVQSVDAWSDTRITFTPARGALGAGLFTIHVDRV